MSKWDGLDRRRFPRVQYPCLVVVQRSKDAEMHLTHTDNVGIGGVCVSLKENVKIFSEVRVEIDLLDLDDHIKTDAKVVWNVERSSANNKYYDVGLEFVNLPDRDKKRLEDIIQRFYYRKV